MILSDSHSDSDGDDEDEESDNCDNSSEDEEQLEEEGSDEESDDHSSEYPETSSMEVDRDSECVRDYEIDENYGDQLRSRALMALDTKMLLSLESIHSKIANLTGHDLVNFFIKAAGLWDDDAQSYLSNRKLKYANIGLAFRLCVALENQDPAPYSTILRESCWWGSEDSVVRTMRCILPADNKEIITERMRTLEMRHDKIAVRWAWRLQQMATHPHRIIKAMYSLQETNEPKLRELLIQRLEKFGTEEIRALLFPWIWELSREGSGRLGQEALDLYVGKSSHEEEEEI
ncbi:hypothetical protein Plec18167_006357 [Paecilomyces lecythidis]|uniref:Uncharacterized protein n=1 Tax=Paecilomyces lecythidis TaxID=3004212 RepID=A0ABR3XBK4_9EURO